MRGVEHETWRKYRRFFAELGVSGWDGIAKVHTLTGNWNKARDKDKRRISFAKHLRKAERVHRHAFARPTGQADADLIPRRSKTPKRRSLRPSSYERSNASKMRKLKGPAYWVEDPRWEW